MPKLTVTEFHLCQLKLFSPTLVIVHNALKLKNRFSNKSNILYGVPQGLILGPLLFSCLILTLLIYSTNVKNMILLAMLMTQPHTFEELTLNQSLQNYRLQLINFFTGFNTESLRMFIKYFLNAYSDAKHYSILSYL